MMDELLVPLHRQYLQQIAPTNIRLPPARLLVNPDIQNQLSRYFFDDTVDAFLPPSEYQRKVLKRFINEIERELATGKYEAEEHEVSDALMSRMGFLSTIPVLPDVDGAHRLRVLSYFLPTDAQSCADAGVVATNSAGHSRRILIEEAPNLLASGSNVGLRTWEACLHLASYLSTCKDLERHHPAARSIAGTNVLELGAGTGLLSLICSLLLNAARAVCTDGLPHVVERIKRNIGLNDDFGQFPTKSSPVATILDWTDLSNLEKLFQDGNGEKIQYDYIFGADITYHPDLLDPLVSLIRAVLDRCPKARVLISATMRNEATMALFRELCTKKHGLSIRDIGEDEWKCPEYRSQTGLFHEQVFDIVIMDIRKC